MTRDDAPELLEAWTRLGYSKWAGLAEHLEFAIIEALLWDVQEVSYVSTSESDYPAFPLPGAGEVPTTDEIESAGKLLAAARRAVEIRRSFRAPPWPDGTGFRTYVGQAADAFEEFAAERRSIPDPLDPTDENAFIAADLFVQIAMRNRNYEESWGDWETVRDE